MNDKILSCFIDESGDFGPYNYHAPLYIVSVVLHDQCIDISDHIQALEEHMSRLGYPNHALHTGPLIRRETDYEYSLMEKRKHLFNVLYNFARKLPIQYFSVSIKKSECVDSIQQTAKLSKALSTELRAHENIFRSFDQIIVYYDNGQTELTKIITSVFNALFSNVDIRRVKPVDYKLFQVADLICTMEMLNEKTTSNSLTRSETEFFHSAREFHKEYYRKIVKKHI